MTDQDGAAILSTIAAACTPENRENNRPSPECIDDYCRALLAGITYAAIAEAAVVSEPAIIATVRRAAERGNPLAIKARAATAARRGGPGSRRTLTGAQRQPSGVVAVDDGEWTTYSPSSS